MSRWPPLDHVSPYRSCGRFPSTVLKVLKEGIEPSIPKALVSKTSAYAKFRHLSKAQGDAMSTRPRAHADTFVVRSIRRYPVC